MAFKNFTAPALPNKIYDKKKDKSYLVEKKIGEGGFASCYRVIDSSNKAFACKAVYKPSLKSEKHREKLKSEIKVHDSLNHPYICSLRTCFQDENYIYIILELCENQSLGDMIKRRKRVSEEEARYFMLQMFSGIGYCHKNQVIHRDIKLGNVFLDSDMNVKIGDFGLAAQLESEEDRKKTICGTPNYIAPEVLYDTKNGHSFKADIWSLGVMLYTLVIGIPPFQTKDANEIYKRIQVANFSFPSDKKASDEFKSCVKFILNPDPEARPGLDQIKAHAFFDAFTPKELPQTAFYSAPDFTYDIRQHELTRDMLKKQKATTEETAASEQALQTPSGNKRKLFHYQITPDKRSNVATASLAHTSATKAMRDAILALPDMTNFSVIETMNFNLKQARSYIQAFNTIKGLERLTKYEPKVPVLIRKWVDQGAKYGLAYELTDDTQAVFFKDTTTFTLNPVSPKYHYLYTSSNATTSQPITQDSYSINEIPEPLAKKAKLFDAYRNYMSSKLTSSIPTVPFAGFETPLYVTKFIKTTDAALFRLSSNVIQINFKDHYKLVLSEDACILNLIHPSGEIITLKTIEVIASHYKVNELQPCFDTEDAYYRLKYAQDMLQGIIEKSRKKVTTEN
jgi:serine/threonine protein kinase